MNHDRVNLLELKKKGWRIIHQRLILNLVQCIDIPSSSIQFKFDQLTAN